jgi:predicted RNA-binding Zn-ribbon protein involved in translation (DUF1610 family)
MEIVIIVFVVVGGSIALSAWLKNKAPQGAQSVETQTDPAKVSCVRTCQKCGHNGEMKTWIAHYAAPKFILIAGFLLGYIPGLIFLALYWGKYKCPNCGAIGKN